MSNDLKFIGLLIGVPVVLFWLLVLLPRKAAVPLSILAISVTFYAIWVNVTDKGQPNQVDLGPYLRSIAALLALAGPVMALIFHLIGRRLWRWRLACFAAGFPLGYGLVWLFRQIDWFHDFLAKPDEGSFSSSRPLACMGIGPLVAVQDAQSAEPAKRPAKRLDADGGKCMRPSASSP